jgi:glucokinase
MELAIGIDIGGTNTEFGLVNQTGDILFSGSVKTNAYPDVNDFLGVLSEKINSTISENQGSYKIAGVGVGAPNGNHFNGTIEHVPNIPWKGIVPMVSSLKKLLKLPVFIDNDANAAATGEMVFGGAKGMENFVVVTLGTGLGAGFVINGRMMYGHDSFAGELGHTIVNPKGRSCKCGRRGCLETYASATGIKRTVYKMIANSVDESSLSEVPFTDLTSRKIAEAAQHGDIVARRAFEYTGKILGKQLADTVAITGPEAIFLTGGLAKSKELIFGPTQKYMEAYMLNIFKHKVKLLPSELIDKNAAILGASAMVWNKLK